jgi:hypothetical protein
MAARAPLPALAGAFPIPADETIDLVIVLVDQSLDLLATRPGLGACVGDCSAKADIVANEFLTLRIFEGVVDVSLLHLEMTVDITTIMRLPAF